MSEASTLSRLTATVSWRIIFAIALVVALALFFWTQSRYPSLDDKALMTGSIQLEDPLSFEVVFPIDPTYPLWKKIAYTSINWAKTNQNGMIFGILFGAAFLTLLRYLPKRSFKGAFANSVLGMTIGAPLGVCVNCAAPIAKGLYSAGGRAETTLSAMIASPTLNVVVLTMAFSIMPFYLAMTKLLLSFVVILIAVPAIVALLPKDQLLASGERLSGEACAIAPLTLVSDGEGPFSALMGVLGDYLKNLWYIFYMTVPLMLLAGVLGATVAHLIPLETLKDLSVNPLTLLAVGVIGVFMPVPIAFDVVISGTLLNAGLPVGIIMVLLFTLGSFSIYSFLIVGRAISFRAAGLVTAAVVLLAVISGLGAQYYQDRQLENAINVLTSDPAPKD